MQNAAADSTSDLLPRRTGRTSSTAADVLSLLGLVLSIGGLGKKVQWGRRCQQSYMQTNVYITCQ
jgi:hypothetical protein